MPQTCLPSLNAMRVYILWPAKETRIVPKARHPSLPRCGKAQNPSSQVPYLPCLTRFYPAFSNPTSTLLSLTMLWETDLTILPPSTLSYLPEANPTKAKRRLRLSVPPKPLTALPNSVLPPSKLSALPKRIALHALTALPNSLSFVNKDK